MFGTRYVGAIHGRLLTAWSAAGIFGPVLVNYIREYQIDHGVPKAEAYNVDDVHHGRRCWWSASSATAWSGRSTSAIT